MIAAIRNEIKNKISFLNYPLEMCMWLFQKVSKKNLGLIDKEIINVSDLQSSSNIGIHLYDDIGVYKR